MGPVDQAASVAAEYAHIEGRIAAWAANDEAVRAAVVVGSRTRADHPADEWADLDVVLVTDDHVPLVADQSWVEGIADPLIRFVDRRGGGDGTELRVLFAGGYDVDFAFVSVDEAERLMEHDPRTAAILLGRGHRVLLDRDGLLGRILEMLPSVMDHASTSAPDQAAFGAVCSDFWYHTVWTSKHLARGELWWAKSCCDSYLKDRLERVLEWQATAEGRDSWFRGRFFEEWADPDVVAGLRRAFAHYDEAEVRAALDVTMDLFGKVARRTAEELDLAYDGEAESHARALVSEIRARS